MSFDPGVIISIIENCMKVYKYAADVKHTSKERRRLRDEVQSLQSQLAALQKLVEKPGIAGDADSMGQLANVLDSSEPFAKMADETLGRVKDVLAYGTSDPKATRFKVLGKRGAAALWWTVDKAEVKGLLADLKRYKSRIELALQHEIFTKQHVMDGKLVVVDGKQDGIEGRLDVVDGKQVIIDGKQDILDEKLVVINGKQDAVGL